MKKHLSHLFVVALFAALLCAVEAAAAGAGQTTKPAASPVSGFRTEFLTILEDTEKKIISLAQATPEEKYSWRPMEGVRSVSEVYMHMVASNIRSLQPLGVKPPAGIGTDLEKITDKAKVVELLKQSFAHVRQAAANIPDADWDKSVTLPSRTSNVREIFFRLALGMREHLGQSVAYARTNRIVPPWTAEREAQQKRSSAP